MEEWMRQSVSQLKKLVKSRAGRIAELQMEIKILEGIIDRKVSQGDLGGSATESPEKPAKPSTKEAPKLEEPAKEPEKPEEKPQLEKISKKSSDHAFEEMD